MERYASIVEAVAEHAKTKADKIAIIEGDVKCDYGSLWRNICRYAGLLKEQGAKKGEYIVLRATNTIAYLTQLLAIHLIGATAVPVEKNAPTERMLEIIEEVNARYVIADAVFPFSGQILSEKVDFSELEDCVWKVEFPKADAVADILFTTGTTGKSKGVVLSHRSIIAVAENIIDYAEMQEDEIELIPLPLNHTHGLRRCYSNLYNGSTISLMNGFSKPLEFYRALEKDKITSFSITPLMFTIIVRVMGEKLLDYRKQIRYVQFGASATPEADKEKARELFPDSRLYNAYGTTEAGATAAYDFNVKNVRVSCIGQPSINGKIFFVDKDRNVVNATKDNPGFISIDSDVVMEGYWNEPELTKEVMEDGKYFSKDLGYMDEEGYVYFAGRADDIINIGGIKISPLEIEEVALRYGKIKECLCTTYEDEQMGKMLKLCVVMNDGEVFDKQQIESYLKQHLENSRMPKKIEEIEKVARSYNDKILRNQN